MSYNGWTNRETWAVDLWLTDEPGRVPDIEVAPDPDSLQEYVEDLWEDFRRYVADLWKKSVGSSHGDWVADMIDDAFVYWDKINWEEIHKNLYSTF